MRLLVFLLMAFGSLAHCAVRSLDWSEVPDSQQLGWNRIQIPGRKIELSFFSNQELELSRVYTLGRGFLLLDLRHKESTRLHTYQVMLESSKEPVLLHETPLREGAGFDVSQEAITFSYDYLDPLDPVPPRSRIESVFSLNESFSQKEKERFKKAPGLRGYFQELHYFAKNDDWERFGDSLEFLEKGLRDEGVFLLEQSARKEELSRVLLLKADLQFQVENPKGGFAIYYEVLKSLPDTQGALVALAELDRVKRLGQEVYLRLRK
ncbi:hypothetical protein HOF92_17120 [bacterium]|jgi:hypothetical protein|nr:hypothetical protein [bacterium]